MLTDIAPPPSMAGMCFWVLCCVLKVELACSLGFLIFDRFVSWQDCMEDGMNVVKINL